MTKKKTRSRYKKPRKQKVYLFSIKRFAIFLFLFVCFSFTIYGLYLNQIIKNKFETNRWALPAKIYARVLELYPGMPISIKDLEIELYQAGYRKDKIASTQGSFSRSRGQITIVLRDYFFPDGSYRQSKRVKISLSKGKVVKITDQKKNSILPILRLEPPLIDTIYPLLNEDRILVKDKEIPTLLIKSLTAVEDKNFFQHPGVDPLGIMRAIWVNIQAGQMRQGGSTLTQQLVKNYFLSNERTLKRKMKEAIMAILLEINYSKKEIITAYINAVFLAQNGRQAIHGFALAAQYFYKRKLKQLSLPQIAMLVGLVKGPSYYNPIRHPKRAISRRNLVLKILRDQKLISAKQFQAASQARLGISRQSKSQQSKYPAFMSLLRRHLRHNYNSNDLMTEGLKIYTSFDPRIQEKTQKAISRSIRRLPGHKNLQAAMLVSRRGTSELLAVIGSKDNKSVHFNRAIDAERSIGSLVKPPIYLTALEKGYYTDTLIDDSPITLEPNKGEFWQPQNFDRRSHGWVSLEQALSQSYNIATVRLGLKLGLDRISTSLRNLGFGEQMDLYPAMLLGAIPMQPIQVQQIYQTIADGGFYAPLKTIRAVMDNNNNILEYSSIDIEKRFSRNSIEQLEQMLIQVVYNGTGKALQKYLPSVEGIFAKTGTTNKNRDSWFVAYDDKYVSTVWLGNDKNLETKVTGATGALKIWAEVKKNALKY